MQTLWKGVIGYEESYDISNKGQARTLTIYAIKVGITWKDTIYPLEVKMYTEEQVIDLLFRTESTPLHEREYMPEWIKDNL